MKIYWLDDRLPHLRIAGVEAVSGLLPHLWQVQHSYYEQRRREGVFPVLWLRGDLHTSHSKPHP